MQLEARSFVKNTRGIDDKMGKIALRETVNAEDEEIWILGGNFLKKGP